MSDLQSIVERVGKDFGYKKASAEFTEFKDFKISWSRSTEWINLKVSDYLKFAPDHILEQVLRTLFAMMNGKPADYSEEVCEWFNSEEFRALNQDLYRTRAGVRGVGTHGGRYDLDDIVAELVEDGRVPEIDDLVIEWLPSGSRPVASNIMRVVGIPHTVDHVDEELAKYYVFHQLAKVAIEFPGSHDKGLFMGLIASYPDCLRLEDACLEAGLIL